MSAVICTVDVVLLTLLGEELAAVLLRREHAPFAGELAIPGGYVHPEDDLSAYDAAMRVIKDKTGIVAPYLEQLATFSGAGRDPRGWSVSVAHYALVPHDLLASRKDEAVHIVPLSQLGPLPFDHQAIIATALERLRNKSQYSSLPCFLAGDTFTLPQLQRMYELLLGEPLNKVSFRRKMSEMAMLDPVDGQFEAGGAHRPAQLYRLKAAVKKTLTVLERGL
ncbi:NUDIX hydrolase [Massilia atriviolacea]|uniref:NUDIX domain-containing protein n=1 Tax=Massilia atriviolacea TaxID=2495579 RepID=A0A430HFM8_9BURK|nr:NUDIX domain-containing protein [Massilia atriviolacea]RSZ56302.1 NUDIX domain-containing protein [Massilia atriviolacea]